MKIQNNNKSRICAVVMAGGAGTRLWPLSRASHPKQFLSLHGEDTMLQSTVKRLSGLDVKSLVTICNEDHRFFVAEQLREIEKLGPIILEPAGRNTAPAIALAAFSCKDDPLLLVLAADHVIQNKTAFTEAVLAAVPLAESGKLVTFGIVPDAPNTGYGYIKRGEEEAAGYAVDQFVEKPSLERAQEYLDSGDYYWNSGMFLFKASRYLEELEKYRPDIYEACQLSMEDSSQDYDFIRVEDNQFELCPSESIDYAVMEQTESAVVVPLDAGWSDIGSWSSLWDISEKDEKGNSINGDVVLQNTTETYVRTDGQLVSLIGVNSLIIVATKDAVLVANKDDVHEVNAIIKQLKSDERSEWEYHREVHRPWGKYDSIGESEGYKVKRITVNPGGKLSLQQHKYRSEHWVVVSGEAKVTNGDNVFSLSENQSTYIPAGVVHRLENPGETPLHLIEVQTGSYLEEDDIVRFEDSYGRLKNI
jgi:mannose-1-phosphate guanylyltransferase